MAVNISEEKMTVYDMNGNIEREIRLGKVDKPKDRILIDIPADGNYIEIMGHKIDGFSSFQEFRDYLGKRAEIEYENQVLKNNWDKLRRYLVDYRYEKSRKS